MGWFGKMTFGTMGLLFGGPLGAIIGVSLGHHLVDKKAEYGQSGAVPPKSEQAQAAYFVCIFSILGKIAKADGVVTNDELKVVDDFINGMNISETEKQFAKQVFNEAKNSNYSVEDFASQFYQINSGQPAVLHSFLDVLFLNTKKRPKSIIGILSHWPVENIGIMSSKPPWLSFTNSTKNRTLKRTVKNIPNKYPLERLGLLLYK